MISLFAYYYPMFPFYIQDDPAMSRLIHLMVVSDAPMSIESAQGKGSQFRKDVN
jgi:hypothetical protein